MLLLRLLNWLLLRLRRRESSISCCLGLPPPHKLCFSLLISSLLCDELVPEMMPGSEHPVHQREMVPWEQSARLARCSPSRRGSQPRTVPRDPLPRHPCTSRGWRLYRGWMHIPASPGDGGCTGDGCTFSAPQSTQQLCLWYRMLCKAGKASPGKHRHCALGKQSVFSCLPEREKAEKGKQVLLLETATF